jgi:DNA-binding XRE family transcriptional regulator
MEVRTFLPYCKVVKKPLSKAMPLHLITLGDHIRKKRIETNRMQQYVAQIIGVTEDCITNWENNRNQPQIHLYPAIINFLGYHPFTFDEVALAEKIKGFRYINGWTCEDFGEQIGVHGSTVSAWERQRTIPRKTHQERIEIVLNRYS